MKLATWLQKAVKFQTFGVLLLVLSEGLGTPAAVAQTLPVLPNIPDISCLSAAAPSTPPTTIQVPAGGDFQAALNTANLGDTIVLEAGATFTGNFTLPNKTGTGCIIVTSSASGASLPQAGNRIDPSYAPALPKLVSPNTLPAISATNGAHHFQFTNLEILATSGMSSDGLVSIGSGGETATDMLPHHIGFDRVYVHGDPLNGAKRGIALNGASITVKNSYISEIKRVGQDTQAICGWNGAGPFRITNNYLEAAGEIVLFGGADPKISNLVPSDIEIRNNYFTKPLSWKIGDPSYAGTPWSVKNLLELKNARRVLIYANVFEHNWPQAQVGFAILFTVRNQDGTAPWSTVEDVTFTNNVVRSTASGVNILGQDYTQPSQHVQRLLIQNNVFVDVGTPPWGGAGDGILFQIVSGPTGLTIQNNTAFQTGNIITADGTPPSSGFFFQNNIVPHNPYGVIGTNTAPGLSTLNTYFPGYVFQKNVIVANPYISQYPANNFYPASFSAVGFVDQTGGNDQLSSTSPYKNAGTDGKDLGVDWNLFAVAQYTQPLIPGASTSTTTSTTPSISTTTTPTTPTTTTAPTTPSTPTAPTTPTTPTTSTTPATPTAPTTPTISPKGGGMRGFIERLLENFKK